MAKRLVRVDHVLAGTVYVVLLLFVAGCADPARVVLYEERHGSNPSKQLAIPSPKPPLVSPSSDVSRARSALEGPVRFHKVRSGDTVYFVSQRYHVPVRGLIKMNGLRAPYILRSGQTLRLPKSRSHVVERGDTVYAIAQKYGVALSRLVQSNGINPPYQILVGQVLRLPDSVASVSDIPKTRKSALLAPKKPSVASGGLKPAPTSQSMNATKPSPNLPVAIPKPPPLSKKGKFLLPVRGRLLSRFGNKGRGLRNDGVNIAALRGDPVHAVENGIVVYSGNALLGFGNMVLLRHANGFMTAYAHNEKLSVLRGDTVRRGQVIATVGSSGNVSAPQLHFEIRKGKRAVDPLKYLPSLSSRS